MFTTPCDELSPMVRSAVFLILFLPVGSPPMRAQHVSPHRQSLAEQIRSHYYIHDSIAAALPGYVGFSTDDIDPCYMVVHLIDTLAWADSARALFRHALPDDTSEVAQQYCAGHTEVRVRAARYSVAELSAFVSRIDSVLAEPELRVRGGAWFTAESLIVTAHSRAALERARIRLAREARIPQAMLLFRV